MPMGSQSGMQVQGGMAPAGDATPSADVEIVAVGAMAAHANATLESGTSMITAPLWLRWGDSLQTKALPW